MQQLCCEEKNKTAAVSKNKHRFYIRIGAFFLLGKPSGSQYAWIRTFKAYILYEIYSLDFAAPTGAL
jgi:hypothetical protein